MRVPVVRPQLTTDRAILVVQSVHGSVPQVNHPATHQSQDMIVTGPVLAVPLIVVVEAQPHRRRTHVVNVLMVRRRQQLPLRRLVTHARKMNGKDVRVVQIDVGLSKSLLVLGEAVDATVMTVVMDLLSRVAEDLILAEEARDQVVLGSPIRSRQLVPRLGRL